LEELQQDLEIQTDLANNRLTELKEITERNKSLSAEVECCKMKVYFCILRKFFLKLFV